MQFIEPREKLADIDSYIHMVLSVSCQCDLGDNNILRSFFTCPEGTPPDQVLYRTALREVERRNCTELVSAYGSAIPSSTAPPLLVLGNILKIRQDCDVEAPAIDSDLICLPPVVSTPITSTNPPLQLGAIVGGVVAGLVVILVLAVLLIVVVFRRRRRARMRIL